MKLFIFFALFTICLSTPVDQGRQFRDETRTSDGTVTGKYGYQDPSGKDGFVATGDGIPVVASVPGQPLVLTGEPASVVYGTKQPKGGQVSSSQDQQVYLTGEEEVEVREEGLNSELKVDVDSKSDEVPKPLELLVADTSSNTPVGHSQKLAKKQVVLVPGVQYSEQPFPQVVSGQRRLVEPVAGVKGKVSYQSSGFVSPFGKQHILYQTGQHTVPVHIQEIVRVPLHSVSSVQNHVVGGLKKPAIQYQINQPNPVYQQFLSPVNRKQAQVLYSGIQQPVIGDQRQVQYVLQPVFHQNPGVDQRQFSVQPELQQVFGVSQSNAQVLSGVKGYGVDQRPVDQKYFSVEQVGNVEERHDVARKEVGVVPVAQTGVQQLSVVPVVQPQLQQVGVTPVVQAGVQQVGVDLVSVVQSPGVQQVGVGTDQRQVQVVSGVHDTSKPQVLNQKHVVNQVGGPNDQRDVHLVHSGVQGVEGVGYRVVQHFVKPESVVSVQQQRVSPFIGVQQVVPVERRNVVPYEAYFAQQSPQVQVPNQAVVVSPWVSQYGYQLRQPFIQYQQQAVPQQVSVSNLQEYYQSVRESPVSQIGQISQPVENQYYSQYPSVVQPVQYSGIEPGQEFIRRDGSDIAVEKQPDISVRSIFVEQKPGSYAQNYGTKSINV